jgi:hypothetical protein
LDGGLGDLVHLPLVEQDIVAAVGPAKERDGKIYIIIILFFWGQRPHVPLLLLGPPFLPIILFGSTTLLSGMTGISLHMQWPLTSQLHGSVSRREQLVFHCKSNSMPFIILLFHFIKSPNQGCRMVHYHAKNTNLGVFWRIEKMLVYFKLIT